MRRFPFPAFLARARQKVRALSSRGLRGTLIERYRRWTYGDIAPLSAWRKRLWIWRNKHATLIFEGPVSIGPRCSLYVPGPATMRVGPNVEFRRGCHIELNLFSELTIGEGTRFTYNAVIQCVRSITIGKGCLIGTGTSIVDGKHAFRGQSARLEEHGLVYEPLTIGDDVLVNTKATITADVGTRAVIAAHAVVTRPIPPYTLAAGLPAKVVEHFGPKDDTPEG